MWLLIGLNGPITGESYQHACFTLIKTEQMILMFTRQVDTVEPDGQGGNDSYREGASLMSMQVSYPLI